MSIRPTARGWAVLATAVSAWIGGVWTGYPAVVGLAAALTVAGVAAVVSVIVPVPVTVERSVHPARVARFEPCHATIRVANTARRWPVTLSGTDRVEGVPVLFDFPPLPAGERAETTVRISTERRGLITFGPLTLDRRSFADLLRVRRPQGQAAAVLVEPRLLDAAGVPAGLRRSHVGAEERIAHGGTDLVGLREYLPGDDLRRLHWATSARRGTLMVREDADPATPYLTVLLDDRAASYETGGFDEAVDLAASLLDAAARGRATARLMTVSGALDLELTVAPGQRDTGRISPEALVTLATIVPSTAEAPVHAAVSSPDVVAVVSGAAAAQSDLLLTAAAAPVGVVAFVDPAPVRLISTSGDVVVLRGPRAEDLVGAWRTAIADGAVTR